jgi:hypothetical protein
LGRAFYARIGRAIGVCLRYENRGFLMKKIYITKGYNSYTNKELIKAFTSESESNAFMEGLTDPHVHIVKYKSTIELVNYLLKGA